MSTVSQQPKEGGGKIRKVSYLPFPASEKNKNRENSPGDLFSPFKLQQLEEGQNHGGGGAVQEITRIWQVEAPKYPRNKFCRLGQGWGVGGVTESSLLETRGGD